MRKPTAKDLRDAGDEFGALLAKRGTAESDFQNLFTRRPYILSSSLPVRLEPADIVAGGRPGREEADFVFYPRVDRVPFVYGAIELKRPDTGILRASRKDLLILSRDAETALRQAEKFARRLKRELATRKSRLLAMGSDEYIFLVLGLSNELVSTVTNAERRQQFESRLPVNCRLFPYDTLLKMFEQRVPRRTLIALPEALADRRALELLEPLGVGDDFVMHLARLAEVRLQEDQAADMLVVFYCDVLSAQGRPAAIGDEAVARLLRSKRGVIRYLPLVRGFLAAATVPGVSSNRPDLFQDDIALVVRTIARILDAEVAGWNPRYAQVNGSDGRLYCTGFALHPCDGAGIRVLLGRAVSSALSPDRALLLDRDNFR